MENPYEQMDDLGGPPLFLETFITGSWAHLAPLRLPSTCTAIRQCCGGKDRRKSRAKRTSEGLGGLGKNEANWEWRKKKTFENDEFTGTVDG